MKDTVVIMESKEILERTKIENPIMLTHPIPDFIKEIFGPYKKNMYSGLTMVKFNKYDQKNVKRIDNV